MGRLEQRVLFYWFFSFRWNKFLFLIFSLNYGQGGGGASRGSSRVSNS